QNLTYQSIALKEVDEQGQEEFIGEQIPNIPTLLYNMQFSFKVPLLFGMQDKVTFNASYYHTNEFSITEVLDQSSSNDFNIVPAQHQVDLSAIVKISPSWTVSASVNNVLDRQLFDNFRIPKPGVNGAMKVNFMIN
ncbi:MAG: hypothetical protein AAGG59_17985, partial [Bacteroidota bacterium]